MKRIPALALGLTCSVLSGFGLHAAEAPATANPVARTAVAAQPQTARQDPLWISDFEAAKATAAKEGKDILLDFTGSDWCGWCIKLRKEVFATPEFTAAAPAKFVLVEADFPRDTTRITPAVAKQNERLQEAFDVHGYPTILLLDAQGRPYASTGYQAGGATNYLAHLAELRQIRETRDAAWKKAESAAGVQKAKWLAEGLAALDDDLVAAHYASVITTIKGLDPQDASGLIARIEYKAKLSGLQASIAELDDKPDEVMRLVDGFVAANKPAGENLQKALLLKLSAYPPHTLANVNQAIKLLDRVVALDPATETAKTAGRIKLQAAKYKARLEADAAQPQAPAAATPKP